MIADAGRHIGIAAASLATCSTPSCSSIGGELAQAGETLLAPLRHALERSALAGEHGVPEVVQGELGDRAELLGCLALAIENVGVDTESARGAAVTALEPPRRRPRARHSPALRRGSALASALVAGALAGCTPARTGRQDRTAAARVQDRAVRDVRPAVLRGADRELGELRHHYEVLYSNADQDAAKQQSQAEAALASGRRGDRARPGRLAAAVSIVPRPTRRAFR